MSVTCQATPAAALVDPRCYVQRDSDGKWFGSATGAGPHDWAVWGAGIWVASSVDATASLRYTSGALALGNSLIGTFAFTDGALSATTLQTVWGSWRTDATGNEASIDSIDLALVNAKTTNLPTDPADQSAVEAAITAATSPLATASALATAQTGITTLLSRITANLFSGITYLSRWLGAMAGKTADAGTLAEMQATPAGVTWDNTTDSEQALRDRGDVAWGPGAAGEYSITLTVQTSLAVAIPNQWVWLLDASGAVVSQPQQTNASGQVVWSLNNGTYYPNIAANSSYTWDHTNYAVTVSGAVAATTIVGTAFAAPTPTSAEYCVIYGYLKDLSGTVLASTVDAVQVTPDGSYHNGNTGETVAEVTANTNGSGYFTLQVLRSKHALKSGQTAGNGTGTYTIAVPSQRVEKHGVTIPDAASKDVYLLLF